jgi:hypothetical protein
MVARRGVVVQAGQRREPLDAASAQHARDADGRVAVHVERPVERRRGARDGRVDSHYLARRLAGEQLVDHAPLPQHRKDDPHQVGDGGGRLLGQAPRDAAEHGAVALRVGGDCPCQPHVAVGAGRAIHQMLDERFPARDRHVGRSSGGRALVGPTTRLLAWWGLHWSALLTEPASF